jgi:calcineurin-like phosphoesterase family protein
MYLTSDNHFGHKNIIGYCDRPFQTVEQMDEAMIQRWNHNVGKTATIMVVGDFSFYDAVKTKEITQRLNGRKILIRGNHDKAHSDSWFLKCGFDSVVESMTIPAMVQEDTVEIQHYHDYESRYGYGVLFHGHAHNFFKAKHYVTFKRVLLNVGVDCWNFTPVHIDFLFETVKRIRQQHEEEGKTLWKVGEI